MRIRRKKFLALTEAQLGVRVLPSEDPSLAFVYPDLITNLAAQLAEKPADWGAGEILVFSMLTDGFSPVLVADGTTRTALELVLERTAFRIRILTKNAIVGAPSWIRFFAEHPGRFIVGLSVGTLDDDWARRIEVGTSSPSARLRALRSLQDAGVPTFGMACPVFPDVLEGEGVERLVHAIRPELVEDFWAEPYNDRTNWQAVREGYTPSSRGYEWFTEVYEPRDVALIDVNYICRSATTILAGRRQVLPLVVPLRDRLRSGDCHHHRAGSCRHVPSS